jgi:hypothetical protein
VHGCDRRVRRGRVEERICGSQDKGWLLQMTTIPNVNERTDMDVAALAELLHETAEQHDSFEKAAPPHDWWDWYAAYLNARQNGDTSDQATQAADYYMAQVKHVVAART